jgi:hypothetical protein
MTSNAESRTRNGPDVFLGAAFQWRRLRNTGMTEARFDGRLLVSTQILAERLRCSPGRVFELEAYQRALSEAYPRYPELA